MCGGEEGLGFKDPFGEFIRRYLGFEVLGCRFHRPGSHSLIQKLRRVRGVEKRRDWNKIGSGNSVGKGMGIFLV